MFRFLLLTFFLSPMLAISQIGSIKGVVTSGDEMVPFANVGVVGSSRGAACDENGNFEITKVPVGEYTIQISAIGYKNRKQEVVVKNGKATILSINTEHTGANLDEFVITGTLEELSISESAVPIEVFTPKFFMKNPTPSMFQALEIVNGVRPQINCSVCNTGDVHINGMEGPYTMITIDGMPVVGGLASVYGLNGIPNSMIQRMEIVKGPASTLFGSEAVGGLINVITKTPESAPDLSFDVMGTSWGEINVDLSTKFKLKKATSIIGVNYFNYSNPKDNNRDNFTDVTLQDRVSVFNKWSFARKQNRVATLGFRYVYENRWGGEMQWEPQFRGGDSIYGESIHTNRYEIIGKYQLPLKEKVFLSFSYSDHDQDAAYGTTPYIAQQNIAFAQLHWNKSLKKRHNLLLGSAFRYTFYDDNTPATFSSDSLNPYNNPDEFVLPGVFLQDDISINKKNKVLLGIRYDYDSRHGNIVTPRASYKWMPNEFDILRLSMGTGYRVVNLFTEDHAATSGARDVIIKEALKPEKSINANIHYQKFVNTKFGFIDFNTSLFYTYFTNKISPDYETNPDQIIYDNLEGYAVSRGISFNTSLNFTIPLSLKFGATFLNVFDMNKNEKGNYERQDQLLTEKFSGTFSATYTFYKSNIKIDYSGNVIGPMKLPLVENDFRPGYSSWYSIQNIQITKTFKKGWEVYAGIKNLLNFTPPAYSILRANDPFDKDVNSPDNPYGYTFDPTYVYAANQGIRGFIGVRFSLLK